MSESQSAAVEPPPIRPLALAILAPLLGGLIVFAIDLLLASKHVPVSLSGKEKGLVVAHGSGLYLYLGLVIGLVQAALLLLPKKLGAINAQIFGFAALFSAIFVWANWDLADGPGISKSSYAGALRWGVRIGGPIGISIGVAILAFILRGFVRRKDNFVLAWILGLGCVAGAYVLARYNMLWIPGRYPGIHLQMALGALLFAQAGVFLVARHRPFRLDLGARPWVILALALVAVGVSIGVQRTNDFVPIRSSIPNICRVTSPFQPLIDGAFGRFVPKLNITVKDMEEIREQQVRAGKIDVEAILEKIPNRDQLNILVVALDTLRYDHTTLGGYKKNPTTPNLQRLVDDEGAFHFQQAYTSYPTSNYAYCSFLTGMHAGATPLHLWRAYKTDWSGSEEVYYPKLLSNRDISSIGVFAFSKTHRRNKRFFGMLENGFDLFNPDQASEQAMSAPEINQSLFKQLRERKTKRFFAMAHYMEAHDPYVINPGFDFGNSTKDRYDSEIAYVDDQLGQVIAHLKSQKLWDDTILVVLSDHGEALGDHTFSTHNTSLYECETRVPLVIRIPGLEGRDVPEAVSLTDVMPSLMQVLGIEDPVQRLGLPMLPYMFGYPDLAPRLVYSEQYTPRQTIRDLEQRAVIYERKKLIEVLTSPQRTYEIYDLDKDPGETRNLFGRSEAKDLQESMLGLLAEIAKETKEIIGGEELLEPEERLEKELREALADLRRAETKKDVNRAMGRILSRLRNRYDDLNGLTSLIDPAFMTELRQAVSAKAVERLPDWSSSAVNILRLLPHEENLKYLETLREHRSAHIRYAAELALVRHGGETAKKAEATLLQIAKATPDPVRRFDAVIALAQIGHFEGLEVYGPVLRGSRIAETTWQVGPLLEAFRVAKDPRGLEILADRLTLGELNDFTLRKRTLEYAAAVPGADSDRILLMLASDLDGGLKTSARDALATRYGEAGRDARLSAFELEREAQVALLNGEAEATVSLLTRHREKHEDQPVYLCFPWAKTLGQLGRHGEARGILEDAAKRGDEEQKEAARAWLQHLGDLRWFYRPEDLKATIEVIVAPSLTQRNRAYGTRLKITNDSKVFWPGGALTKGIVLRSWLVGEDGKPLINDGFRAIKMHRINNYLPLKGIAPGESATIDVTGHAPSGRWKGQRIAIAICQQDTEHIPEKENFVWISDGLYDAR